MAEQVQAAMDQMVAPLRDLLDREIFTKEEIQAIVNRRRESEYLLRRPTARKADFLRYIEAEQMLEKLRKLRTAQHKRDEKNNNNESNAAARKSSSHHIGDGHIIQHIYLLFIRAVRKFRSDLSLHLLHADYAKEQKSFKRLGRIYAEALQIFPRQVGLWIEAASQEYFGPSKSIRSARILLQRAIRINPQSQDLWIEYFTLELHYAQTLKGRKKILLRPDENDNEDDDADGDYYKIATIVLKNALQLFKASSDADGIPFRMRFLDTCKRFPKTEQFMEMIQSSLQQDFSDTPEAWIARAMYAAEKNQGGTTKIEERAKEDDDGGDDESDDDEKTDNPSKKRTKLNDPVVSVLQDAIEALPTGGMYVQALRFARSYYNELDDQEEFDVQRRELGTFVETLLHVPAHKHSSPELALEQSDYFESNGQRKDCIRVLKEYCNDTTKVPASLWMRWASLLEDPKKAVGILKRGLERTPMNNPDHRQLLLQFFAMQLEVEDEDPANLSGTFQRILLLAPGKGILKLNEDEETTLQQNAAALDSTAHACLKYLEHGCQSGGLATARRIYSLVLFQSSSGGSIDLETEDDDSGEHMKEFLDKCLEMENDKKRLRRLYDRAIQIFQGTPLEDYYRQQKSDNVIYQ